MNPSSSKKVLLSLGLIAISAAYVVWLKMTGPVSPVTSTTPTSQPSSGTPTGTTPIRGEDDDYTPPVTVNPNPSPAPQPAPVGGYKDGSYTGDAVDAYYGTVQVKAIVSGGKLTDVQILQAPSDRGTTERITDSSMPVLTQEAIKVQSAQVNIISGATQTSQGFIDSLNSALVKAKA